MQDTRCNRGHYTPLRIHTLRNAATVKGIAEQRTIPHLVEISFTYRVFVYDDDGAEY